MKVLYCTNVAAEYRIPFFNKLEERINVEFVITRQSLNDQIYNFGKGTKIEGKVTFIDKSKVKHYIQLLNIVINRDYDICIIPPLDSFGEMIDALIIALLSKIRGKKTIYFWEKWQPSKDIPLKKRVKNLLQKIAFRAINPLINKVLVPGKKSYIYFTNYLRCNPKKITCVINSSIIIEKCKKNNIREEYGIEKNKFVVLYFGRIVRFKGLDILIRAVSLIKNKELVLLICGDGEFKSECEELVKSLRMENVIFTGRIKSSERHNYFRESDLFVLPSRNYNGGIEAWGLTINEAMEMGTPCIVSDHVGCADEIVINKETGLIFESDNYIQLAEKINEVYENKELSNRLIKTAANIVKKTYNYNSMANSFIKQFKSVRRGLE